MTDPTSRTLTLLGFLESRPDWSGAELAERLGVTTRTLRRDVNRLRELGYTVDADAGPGGGYALGRGQVLPPLLLDEGQAVAVTVALARAVQGEDGAAAEDALRALATLDKVTPSALRHRLAALREGLTGSGTADTSREDAARTPVGAELLLPCADAIGRSVRLTFAYRDRHGQETHRTVEPHRLLARGRTWRLVAYDLDRDGWRTFRLDRVTDPRPGTWRFAPRAGAEEQVARLDAPVPPEAWRHRVEVHVHAPLGDVAARLPRDAGCLRPLDPHTTEMVTGGDDPAEAAWWLAHLGLDFTVVGDEAVRAAVAALGERLSHAASAAASAGLSPGAT